MTSLTELQAMLDFMKQNGLSELQADGVKLVLAPQPFVIHPEPLDSELLAASGGKDVLGRDGLTAEQQEAFYGRVVDAGKKE